MANSMIRAVVALLAIPVLVGCSSQPFGQTPNNNTTQPSQVLVAGTASAPATPQGAIAGKPVAPQGQQVVGQFPTSSKPAKNQWTTMHKDGFVGNFKEAGKLLGLTPAEVQKYEEMHMAGACTLMNVPNGVVLDGLTFTDRKNKKPKVQHGAKVALVDAKDRSTQVCDLGGGTIALKFNGCGNHAIVREWTPAKATVAPPAPTPPNACVATQKIRLVIWEAKAVEVSGVKETIAKAGGSSYYDEGDVSRGFGKAFRAEKSAGRLDIGKKPTPVVISLLKANGTEERIHSGQVVGASHSFEMPPRFVDGDVLRILFTGPMTSPTSSQFGPEIRAKRNEFPFKECKSEVHLNAIEASN